MAFMTDGKIVADRPSMKPWITGKVFLMASFLLQKDRQEGDFRLISQLAFKSLFKPYRGMPREIYVIFIARVIQAAGSFVMPLLTLILTEKIGLSPKTAGLYMTAAGLLCGPAAMIGGKLADTFGRKAIIMTIDTMGAGFYILAGLIPFSMATVYCMMAAAVCMNMAGPAHDALLSDLTTPQNRSGAFSLSYMGWNLGFAVGPMIGAVLYKYNLSLVFIGDACMALVARILIGIFIKDTLHKTFELEDVPGGTMEKRENGSVLAVLLKRPVLIYFALITFEYNFVYSQWSFMLPMQVSHTYPQNGVQLFALLASLNGLIVIIFTPLLTKMTEKMQSIRRMVYGGLLYAAGFGMLGFVGTFGWFALSCFIFTLGEIVLAISTMPFIMNHTPASHRGRMSGIMPLIYNLGYTLGPMIMGIVLQYDSISLAWRYLGIFVLVAAGLMRMLEIYSLKADKRIKREEIEE